MDLLGRLDVLAGDQIAEARVALGADRLVEAGHGACRGADLLHVLERELRRLRDLLVGRLALELGRSTSRSAREIFCSRSTMWTGIRIVRDLFATPRCTAWRIHQVAYVENL